MHHWKQQPFLVSGQAQPGPVIPPKQLHNQVSKLTSASSGDSSNTKNPGRAPVTHGKTPVDSLRTDTLTSSPEGINVTSRNKLIKGHCHVMDIDSGKGSSPQLPGSSPQVNGSSPHRSEPASAIVNVQLLCQFILVLKTFLQTFRRTLLAFCLTVSNQFQSLLILIPVYHQLLLVIHTSPQRLYRTLLTRKSPFHQETLTV